jgi:integrase
MTPERQLHDWASSKTLSRFELGGWDVANTAVELVWRCKTEKGWRYYPVVFGRNGRPKKSVVMVGREERNYPEGNFYVRYYEGEKTQYKKIGTDPNKALDALRVQENALRSYAAAAKAGHEIKEDPSRTTLSKAAQAMVREAKQRQRYEAAEVYESHVGEFLRVVGKTKTYVDELTVDDMLNYTEYLADKNARKKACAPRTIHNRWANVKAFYIYCGFDPEKLRRENGKTGKLVAPKYEEKTVEIYEPGELGPFFKALEHDESAYAACKIMLQCGLREQEAMYLEWRNVSLDRGIVHIEGDDRYEFKIKDSEQRDVPIPAKLVEWLRTYRAAHPKDRLVAPTATGQPNSNHLRQVKIAARQAGLNCGGCKTCVATKGKECKRWYLHKFRATAITMWLRSKDMGGAGLDLRTVMRLSGHSDLGSVMRYLSPADNAIVRGHVNGINWGD